MSSQQPIPAGKLFIFSAPSGSGKTTIVKHLLKKGFNMEFSISATSRPPRGNEENGKDYYFLTAEDFRQRINNQEFLEWEEVYAGTYYGTLMSEIERITQKGRNVIFDVDVVGGVNIKRIFQEKALAIFIQPPSVEELRNRLINRNTDNAEIIDMRVEKAEKELTYAPCFDIVIVNDDLETAKKQAEQAILQFLNQ
jgi:guanylate kinase